MPMVAGCKLSMTSNKVPMSCNVTMGPICDGRRGGGEGVEDRIVLLAPMHTKEVNYQKIFRNLEQSGSTDGASAGPRAGAEIAFFIFMIIFWLSRGCGGGVAAGPGQLRAAAVVTLGSGYITPRSQATASVGRKLRS